MAKALWEVEDMMNGETGLESQAFTTKQDIFSTDSNESGSTGSGETQTVGATTLAAVSAQTPVQIALQKLSQIEKELNATFFEREAEIRSVLLGAIAGRHVLLLGPPGTAKSELARAFHAHIIGSKHFEILMGKTTDPSELLGPLSITGLKNDQFTRMSTGFLPDADTAFIDEIYKGNSAVNNINLSIMNEGVWFDNGQKKPANLKFMIAASNEEPEDESLQAFHDRLIFRHWVEYVKDPQNQARLLMMNVQRRNPNWLCHQQSTTIDLQELELVREHVNQITVSGGVIQAFQSLMFELSKLGIVVSDRRQAICMHILQANAVLDGRQQVLTDDFQALTYVLWQKKDDIPNVESQVLKLANPYEENMKRLFQQAHQVFTETMAVAGNKTERANKAIEARGVIEAAAKGIQKLVKTAAQEGRDTTKLQARLQQVSDMNTQLVNECLLFTNHSDDDDAMPF